MGIWTFLKKVFLWWKIKPGPIQPSSKKPLREFIYLDEVSLLSLLSSQTGEITDTKSEQSTDELQASVSGKLSSDIPAVTKSEISSRFQTSNSSSTQTSKKAIVQSWFSELHKIEDIRLISLPKAIPEVSATSDVFADSDLSVCANTTHLKRGELIEFRISLSADPIFQMSTIATEFAGMFEDNPGMFETAVTPNVMKEMLSTNNVLQRLLAGLIPIRATAIDYVVVDHENEEFILLKSVAIALNLVHRPLDLVGVTEHLAYWKDIRRVLFSEAMCICLARISRDGLQNDWTPVKLLDLFGKLMPPGFAGEIRTISNSLVNGEFNTPITTKTENDRNFKLLAEYRDLFLEKVGKCLNHEQMRDSIKLISELSSNTLERMSEQKSAFAELRSHLTSMTGQNVNDNDDLDLRNRARHQNETPLIGKTPTVSPPASMKIPQGQSKLLDVEFVAIYW